MKVLGVLQKYMGMSNYQKFESKLTKDNPQAMWLKLKSHYQSKEIGNQAQVHNNFVSLSSKKLTRINLLWISLAKSVIEERLV
jgi:hypothetical protein